MNVLLAFKKVILASEDKQLELETICRECGSDIDALCSLLDITPTQCILLAAILEHDAYCGGSVVNLAGTFNCKTVDIYMLMDDIEELIHRGFVYRFTEDPEEKFLINPAAMKAFRENRTLEFVVRKCDSTKELASELIRLRSDFDQGKISPDILRRQLIDTVNINIDLQMGRQLTAIAKSFPAIEFMAVAMATINWVNDGGSLSASLLAPLCLNEDEQQALHALLANKNAKGLAGGVLSAGILHALKRNADGIAEILVLTTDTKRALWEAYSNNEQSKRSDSHRPVHDACSTDSSDVDILRPVFKRPAKQMLLDDNEQAQYDDLVALLQQDSMKALNRRLKEAGLKSGFTCLFYGPPGTGKTETAYQIGLATGRDIYQVDMSLIHGKWVGDSEHHAQQIFDQYFKKILQSKTAPILLLNEADAIISKRLVNADSSVGLMYNRVQNIILQALEDFQGILIATTNLEQNFDQAFERRFLYKMRFRLPSATIREKLWKSMIPGIPDDDYRRLADEFPSFAGGQIANVCRKAIIDGALHNRSTDLQRLRIFCRQETLSGDEHPIGFRTCA